MSKFCYALLVFLAVPLLAVSICGPGRPALSGEPIHDRGDNALWMRRHWLHEVTTPEEVAALAENLKARGIRRIYPFLGPMDKDGWPGWRSANGIVRYEPERVRAFFASLHRAAPDIKIIPWTGGVLHKDVHPADGNLRRIFAEHARQIVALGADGIQLNVEPLPTGEPGFRDLLREVKAAIGAKTLSTIAAYPPPTALASLPRCALGTAVPARRLHGRG